MQSLTQSPSTEFCETCAVVDPQEPTVSTQKIIFSTGCATDVCIADLRLRSKNVRYANITITNVTKVMLRIVKSQLIQEKKKYLHIFC